MLRKNLINGFKKYGYYVVSGLMLIAIGITLMTVVNSPNTKNVIDVSSEPISFRLPMNELTVLKEYSDTELLYNKTLNQWEAHKAFSVTSEDLKVFSVAKGTVTEVGSDYERGNFVVIDHGDGLKTLYASLSDEVLVSAGTTVEKGQLIGTASTSATNQTEDGNHLHFVMYKNNAVVNPTTYLNFDNK